MYSIGVQYINLLDSLILTLDDKAGYLLSISFTDLLTGMTLAVLTLYYCTCCAYLILTPLYY